MVEFVKLETEYEEQQIVSKTCSYSRYARYFDESCLPWNSSGHYNKMYLKQSEAYANSVLQVKGFLTLNDVYRLLGIAQCKDGALVGWVISNKLGDGFVDFNIPDNIEDNSSILLDFNVDGYIWDKI